MQQTAGGDMLRLDALTGITRPYVCGDGAGLPGPERQLLDKGGCFVPAEMSTERGVVTLLEARRMRRRRSPPSGMHRRSASPCPRLKSKPHRMRNAPPAGRSVSWAMGRPLRSTAPTTEAAAPWKMGAKNESMSISAFHAATNSEERKCRSG